MREYIEQQKFYWQSKVIEAAVSLGKVAEVELEGEHQDATRRLLTMTVQAGFDDATRQYVLALDALAACPAEQLEVV